MALYLCCAYQDPDFEAWFREAWLKAKPKLNMGKSCVRFKKLEDVPLAVVGRAIRRISVRKFISHYEAYLATLSKKHPKRSATKRSSKKAKAAKAPSTTTKKKTAKKKNQEDPQESQT